LKASRLEASRHRGFPDHGRGRRAMEERARLTVTKRSRSVVFFTGSTATSSCRGGCPGNRQISGRRRNHVGGVAKLVMCEGFHGVGRPAAFFEAGTVMRGRASRWSCCSPSQVILRVFVGKSSGTSFLLAISQSRSFAYLGSTSCSFRSPRRFPHEVLGSPFRCS